MKEAESVSGRLATFAKAVAGKAFERKMSEEFGNGDAWLHKWAKDGDIPTSTIRSDVVASNLPLATNTQCVYNMFIQCGSVSNITLNKCTDIGFVSDIRHVSQDAARVVALEMSGQVRGHNQK